MPCLKALNFELLFPSGVRGPVLFSLFFWFAAVCFSVVAGFFRRLFGTPSSPSPSPFASPRDPPLALVLVLVLVVAVADHHRPLLFVQRTDARGNRSPEPPDLEVRLSSLTSVATRPSQPGKPDPRRGLYRVVVSIAVLITKKDRIDRSTPATLRDRH